MQRSHASYATTGERVGTVREVSDDGRSENGENQECSADAPHLQPKERDSHDGIIGAALAASVRNIAARKELGLRETFEGHTLRYVGCPVERCCSVENLLARNVSQTESADRLRIGYRVETSRKAQSLSPSALASKAEITEEDISRLERGELYPLGLDVLRRLAVALGAPLIELLADPDDEAAHRRGKDAVSPFDVSTLPQSFRNYIQYREARGNSIEEDHLRALASVRFHDNFPETNESWDRVYCAVVAALAIERPKLSATQHGTSKSS
jgi:transcriptional regulator with XRE-family HTH domain